MAKQLKTYQWWLPERGSELQPSWLLNRKIHLEYKQKVFRNCKKQQLNSTIQNQIKANSHLSFFLIIILFYFISSLHHSPERLSFLRAPRIVAEGFYSPRVPLLFVKRVGWEEEEEEDGEVDGVSDCSRSRLRVRSWRDGDLSAQIRVSLHATCHHRHCVRSSQQFARLVRGADRAAWLWHKSNKVKVKTCGAMIPTICSRIFCVAFCPHKIDKALIH